MDDASLSANPRTRVNPPRPNSNESSSNWRPCWENRRGTPAPLEGGITNRNFRARFGGADHVIRVPGKDTNLLGDRPWR